MRGHAFKHSLDFPHCIKRLRVKLGLTQMGLADAVRVEHGPNIVARRDGRLHHPPPGSAR